MNLGITAIGALLIALIGLAAGIIIFTAQRKLSAGHLRSLMRWLFATVMLCGFPYAVWNFLLESEIVVIEDVFARQIPGMFLVAIFFILMLKSALVARGMGETFGFGDQAKEMKKELEKVRK